MKLASTIKLLLSSQDIDLTMYSRHVWAHR